MIGSMDKQILFSNNAKVKMADRGAFEDEVIKAIKEGSSEPSRKGRLLFRKNFPFNSMWRGKYYPIKQVAPVVADENDRMVVVTCVCLLFLGR